MISQSWYVCPKTLSKACRRYFSPFRQFITTLTFALRISVTLGSPTPQVARRACRPVRPESTRHSQVRLSPGLPGRLTGLPQLVQILNVPIRVHTCPESIVDQHHQFSILGNLLQRTALEVARVVVAEIVEDGAIKYEEPAIDDSGRRLRFFNEQCRSVLFDFQFAEQRRRSHTQ